MRDKVKDAWKADPLLVILSALFLAGIPLLLLAALVVSVVRFIS